MRAANRRLALERMAQNKPTSIFYRVSFRFQENMFRVNVKRDGKSMHFGYFDDEADAGRKADDVARVLGETDRLNFTAAGTLTGYDGSENSLAAGTANLVAAKAARKKSGYIGVSEDKSKGPKKWFARVRVPNCILRVDTKACATAATKCTCGLGTTQIKGDRLFLTDKEAAREYDRLVGIYKLTRELNFPVVLQVS